MEEQVQSIQPKGAQYYLSLANAAKERGVSQDYLRFLIFKKKLQGLKIGRNWVTTNAWLDAYLEHNGHAKFRSPYAPKKMAESQTLGDKAMPVKNFPSGRSRLEIANPVPALFKKSIGAYAYPAFRTTAMLVTVASASLAFGTFALHANQKIDAAVFRPFAFEDAWLSPAEGVAAMIAVNDRLQGALRDALQETERDAAAVPSSLASSANIFPRAYFKNNSARQLAGFFDFITQPFKQVTESFGLALCRTLYHSCAAVSPLAQKIPRTAASSEAETSAATSTEIQTMPAGQASHGGAGVWRPAASTHVTEITRVREVTERTAVQTVLPVDLTILKRDILADLGSINGSIRAEFESAIQALRDRMGNSEVRFVNIGAQPSTNTIAPVVLSQKLDKLYDVALYQPTVQNGMTIASGGINISSGGITADTITLRQGITITSSATSSFSNLSVSGNLGIGTTSPWGLLSINPNGIGSGPEFVIGSSTKTDLVVSNAGLVGIGTTSPAQLFSVAGHCVTGDTRLRRRRRKKKNANGEWEYDYDDVQIKDVQAGDEILTLDEETGILVWNRVNALMDMGVKPIYKLTTASGKTIRTTAEHPYLVKIKTRGTLNILAGEGDMGPAHLGTASEGKLLEKWDSHRPRRHVAVGSLSSAAPVRAEGFSVRGFSRTRVGIFIDSSNLYHAAKKAQWQISLRHLKQVFEQAFDVVCANCYLVIPREGDPTRAGMLSYAKAAGYFFTVKQKPLKYIIDEETERELKKGDIDLDLSMDVMRTLPQLDAIVVMSGDSDYRTLASYTKEYGIPTVFVSYKDAMAWELRLGEHLFLERIRRSIERGVNITNPNLSAGAVLTASVIARAIKLSSGPVDNNTATIRGGVWTKVHALTEGVEIAVMSDDHRTAAWDRIVSIEHTTPEHVYDIEVANTHNFIGNDIVAHNTYITGGLGIGKATTTSNMLDVAGNGVFGGFVSASTFNATSTTATSTIAGFLDVTGTGTNATSTYASNLWVKGTLRTGTGSLYLNDSALSSLDNNLFLSRNANSYFNGGNVGIGTTSPSGKLTVTGSSAADSGNNALIVGNDNNGYTQLSIRSDSRSWEWQVAGSGASGGASGIINLRDNTAGANRVTINTSGNLGIGTTSPVAVLAVNGASALSGALSVGASYAGTAPPANGMIIAGNVGIGTTSPGTLVAIHGSAPILTLGDSQSSGAQYRLRNGSVAAGTFDIYDNGAAASRLAITNSGNVGIGTTSPMAVLSVNSGQIVGAAGTAGAPTYAFSGNANTGIFNGGLNSNVLAFSTGGTERARIDNAGNLGIGTTSPAQLLSVAGHCVTGDTRLRRRRRKKKNANGEWEYDYDEVEIKDVHEGDEIASLDERTGAIVWNKVNALMDMGVKTTYRLKTADGREIRTTATHPYLVKDIGRRAAKHASSIAGAGWLTTDRIGIGDYIAVPKPKLGVFIDDANMFYIQKKEGWRIDYVKLRRLFASSFDVRFMNYYLVMPGERDTAFQKTKQFLDPFMRSFGAVLTLRTKSLKYIFDREKKEWTKKGNVDSELLIDVLAREDEIDAVAIVSGDSDYKALAETLAKKGKKVFFAAFESNMAWELRQMKHLYLNRIKTAIALGKEKAPEQAGVPLLPPVYAPDTFLSTPAGENSDMVWVKVQSLEKVGEEHVYDIEVEGTHNFLGNDIVAHNTYITGGLGIGQTETTNGNITGTGRLSITSTTATSTFSTGGLTVGTSQFVVQQTSGNVGIGTTSPMAVLSVNSGQIVGAAGTAAAPTYAFSSNANTGIFNGGLNSNVLAFSTGGSERMRLDSSGNLGIGTTSPPQLLSVAGHCVTGDTKLRRKRKRRRKNERGEWIEEEYFELVRIDQILPGDEIVTLNEKTGIFVVSKVNALMDMGVKPIYTLTTATGKKIRTTGEHPYLMAPDALPEKAALFIDGANFEQSAGQIKSWANYQEMAASFGHGLLRTYTIDFGTKEQGGFFTRLKRLGFSLITKSIKVIKQRGEDDKRKGNFDVEIAVDSIALQDAYDIAVLFSGDSDFVYLVRYLQKLGKKVVVISPWRRTARELRLAADIYLNLKQMPFVKEKDNQNRPRRADHDSILHGALPILSQVHPYVKGGVWKKVSEISEGQMIATMGANGKPVFERIIKIEHTPAEQVYDIEVESTHNFIGNDIVAHNTYITGGLGAGVAETTNGNITGTGRLSITSTTATSTFSTGGLTVGTSQLVVQQTSGNVGIGTTSPMAVLSVNSGQIVGAAGSASAPTYAFSSNANTGIFNGGLNSNVLAFSTGGSERMRIDTSGNVGIGTTSPQTALDVESSGGSPQIRARSFSTSGNPLLEAVNDTGVTPQLVIYGSAAGSTLFGLSKANLATLATDRYGATSASALAVGTVQSTPLVFGTNATERMRIDTSGNIGIGTTSPGTLLALHGSAPILTLGDSQSSGAQYRLRNGSVAAGTFDIYDNGAAASRLAITNAGNVGIGTTSPTSKFSVQDSSTFQPAVFYGNGGKGLFLYSDSAYGGLSDVTALGGNGLQFHTSAVTANNYSALQTNGSIRLYADGTGNVGIGTTGPIGKLDIMGANGSAPSQSITPQLVLESSATAGVGVGPVLQFRGQTGNGTANYSFGAIQGVKSSAVAENYSGDLAFFTQNSGGAVALTEWMRITSQGNLGIGTTSPSQLLTVSSGASPRLAIDGTTDARIFFNTAGTIKWQIGTGLSGTNELGIYDQAAGVERLHITTAGNLGIGTTGPAEKLEIVGSAIRVNNVTTPQLKLLIPASTEWEMINTGNLEFKQDNGTTRLTLKSGGNIGIGTTVPDYAFHVAYPGSATAVSLIQRIENSTTATANGAGVGFDFVLVDSAGVRVQTATVQTVWENYLTGTRNAGLAFQTLNAGVIGERVRIDRSGNVGIGTTGPGAKLDVVGTTKLEPGQNNIALNLDGYDLLKWNNSNEIYFGGITASQWQKLHFFTNNAEAMTILSSGNLGIGTTSPAVKVEVNTGALGSFRILSGSGTGFSRYQVGRTGVDADFGVAGATNDFYTGSASGDAAIRGLTGKLLLGTATFGMAIDTSGNVGIGTTSPGSILSVNGVGNFTSATSTFYSGLSGQNTIMSSALMATSSLWVGGTTGSSMVVTQSGNVGIGTTGPGSPLDVRAVGNGLFNLQATTGTNSAYMSFVNTGGTGFIGIDNALGGSITTGSSGYSLGIRPPSGKVVQFGKGDGTSVFVTIDNSGNVGIGTTGPGGKLDVDVGSAASGIRLLHSSGTVAAKWNVTAPGVNNDIVFGVVSNNALRFVTQNVERMVITDGSSGGNVGIGTTSPGTLLALHGSAPILTLGDSQSSGAQYRLRNGSVAAGTFDIYDNGAAASRLAITNAGNLGIGTTSPSQLLTVSSGASPRLAIDGTTDARIFFNTAGTIKWQIGTGLSGTNELGIYDQAAGVERLHITTAGNLGIGTTGPGDKLDVSGGNIRLSTTQNINFGGTAAIINDANGMIFRPTVGANTDSIRIQASQAGNTEIIRFQNNGNVGIGTTSPSAKFAFTGDGTGATRAFVIADSANTERVSILNNGNLGIGTTSPWRTFSVTGTAGVDGLTGSTGAGSLCLSANKEIVYNSGSDACLSSTRATKHDITNLTLDGLSEIRALQPVSFVYNDDTLAKRVRYGFIAEDAGSVDPHFATYNASSTISGIDDRAMISVAVKALQELDARVTALAGASSTSLAPPIISDSIMVKKVASSLGKWSIDENGTLMAVKIITDEIITQKLTVGSASQPNGITLYDEVTHDPYCIKMRSGAMVSVAGACGSTSPVASGSTPLPSPPPAPAPAPAPAPSPAPVPAPTPIPAVASSTPLAPTPEPIPPPAAAPVPATPHAPTPPPETSSSTTTPRAAP